MNIVTFQAISRTDFAYPWPGSRSVMSYLRPLIKTWPTRGSPCSAARRTCTAHGAPRHRSRRARGPAFPPALPSFLPGLDRASPAPGGHEIRREGLPAARARGVGVTTVCLGGTGWEKSVSQGDFCPSRRAGATEFRRGSLWSIAINLPEPGASTRQAAVFGGAGTLPRALGELPWRVETGEVGY